MSIVWQFFGQISKERRNTIQVVLSSETEKIATTREKNMVLHLNEYQ